MEHLPSILEGFSTYMYNNIKCIPLNVTLVNNSGGTYNNKGIFGTLYSRPRGTLCNHNNKSSYNKMKPPWCASCISPMHQKHAMQIRKLIWLKFKITKWWHDNNLIITSVGLKINCSKTPKIWRSLVEFLIKPLQPTPPDYLPIIPVKKLITNAVFYFIFDCHQSSYILISTKTTEIEVFFYVTFLILIIRV